MGSVNEMQEASEVAVVMVPLPAQGHLNSLLHLSHRISSHRIHVHYVGSATHNRQARERFHDRNLSTSPHLHFHDLPFPSHPSPPPTRNPLHKFPVHLQPSFDAATSHLLPHLSSLLHSLSPSYRRIALLHDSSMSFATAAASSIANAEPFAFHAASAISNLFFLGEPNLCRASFRACFSDEFVEWVGLQRMKPSRVVGRIFNTCRGIEGGFLDRLSDHPTMKGQRIFALGPLNPVVLESRNEGECLRWLDEQPAASVVYVSFGTTSSMSREQQRELAAGLEASEQRFIWVLREADRCDIFEASEDFDDNLEFVEFQKRVEGKGKVVRGWVLQLEILAHPSTGGFLSHCGWNSCMEAMSNGVPILAWPMHSDQPANTALLSQILRTGMAIKEWSEKDELVTETEVKDAILRLMVGEEGRDVRRRAKETGEILRAAVMDGGSSKEDLDTFMTYITRP